MTPEGILSFLKAVLNPFVDFVTINKELRYQHRRAVGVRFIFISFVVSIIFVSIEELTNKSFLMIYILLFVGFLTGLGFYILGDMKGGEFERLEKQQKKQEVKQEEATTRQKEAEAGIAEEHRATLEEREAGSQRFKSGEQETEVETISIESNGDKNEYEN